MLFEQLRNLFIGIAVIGCVALAIYFFQPPFKCPLDYTPSESEEYVASVAKWISHYQEAHPDATTDETVSARMEFLLQHGCEDMDKPSDSDHASISITYGSSSGLVSAFRFES